MRHSFWKAILVSFAIYVAAILLGFVADFRYTAFAIAVIQLTWTLVCTFRVVQLRNTGGHRADAPAYDRESYGFALGGAICSSAILVLLVVLSQVV